MVAASWQISLLGELRAQLGDLVVDRFPTRKTAALLGILALRPGHAYGREWLLEQLWPDGDPEVTRARLRSALTALRRLLEPPPMPAGSVIEASKEHVRLLPGNATDLRRFESAMRNAQKPSTLQPRMSVLESVLSICQGELLPGHDEEAIREARFEHILARDALVDELATEYQRRGLTSESELLLARSKRSEWEPWVPVSPLEQVDTPPSKGQPVLPPSLDRFFGRSKELEWLREHLRPGKESRLITIVGLGGTGKTRLSVEAARQAVSAFGGNVWFVDASEAKSWSTLGLAILGSIGDGPSEGLDAWKQSAAILSKQGEGLLILDNCEQLPPEEPAELYALLDAAPMLHVLATSRQLFANSFGVTYELGPLESPSSTPVLAELAENAAARMFIDRARRRRPNFALTPTNLTQIWTIVKRLEGIPLAIELAAAWASALTPAQIATQLEHPLELLVSDRRDSLPRHRSVRSTFEWSIGLLGEETRDFFRDVSIFAGGWDLELAASVLGTPSAHVHLKVLIDACLIRFSLSEAGGRYSMLESLRQLAWSGVEEGRREELKARHLRAMREFAAWAGPKLIVTEDSWIFERVDQERDNLRLALETAANDPMGAELGLGIVADIAHYWGIRCRFTEGSQFIRAALNLPGADRAGPLTCRAMVYLAILVRDGSDYPAALELAEKAVAYSEEIQDPLSRFSAMNCLGSIFQLTGPREEARKSYERGLGMARAMDDPRALAVALCNLAPFVISEGDHKKAREMLEEVQGIDRARGNEGGAVLVHLAELSLLEGDFQSAAENFEQFLRVSLLNGYPGGWCLGFRGLAAVYVKQGRHADATRALALDAFSRQGNEIRLGASDLNRIAQLCQQCRSAMGEDVFDLVWGQAFTTANEKLASLRADFGALRAL